MFCSLYYLVFEICRFMLRTSFKFCKAEEYDECRKVTVISKVVVKYIQTYLAGGKSNARHMVPSLKNVSEIYASLLNSYIIVDDVYNILVGSMIGLVVGKALYTFCNNCNIIFINSSLYIARLPLYFMGHDLLVVSLLYVCHYFSLQLGSWWCRNHTCLAVHMMGNILKDIAG